MKYNLFLLFFNFDFLLKYSKMKRVKTNDFRFIPFSHIFLAVDIAQFKINKKIHD